MARHRKPAKPTPEWLRRLRRTRDHVSDTLRPAGWAVLRLWHRVFPPSAVDLVDPVIGTADVPGSVEREYTTDIREVAGLAHWPAGAERRRLQEPGSRPPVKPWRPDTGWTREIPVPAGPTTFDDADPLERRQLIDLGAVRPHHRNERGPS